MNADAAHLMLPNIAPFAPYQADQAVFDTRL